MMRMDTRQLPRIFTRMAGALLLTSSLMLLISCAVDDRSFHPHEPLFLLLLPTLYKILGWVELAAALFCLFGKNVALQAVLVLWLALNLLVYRISLDYSGVTDGLNGYTGSIGSAFGVNGSLINGFFMATVLYWLFGGLAVVTWSWWSAREQRLHPAIKMSCWSCGTHIKFPIQELGRIIPCPQCQKAITLRKPEKLKMSCFFCQGHIEFPDHAIGEKMPCPHCRMDITLKEHEYKIKT